MPPHRGSARHHGLAHRPAMAHFRQLAMLLTLARLSLCDLTPTVVDQPEHKAQLGNAYTVPGNRLLQRLHFATLDHEPTNFPPVGNNTCVVRHHLNDGASIVVGSSISDDTFVLPSSRDEVGPRPAWGFPAPLRDGEINDALKHSPRSSPR